MPEVPPSLPQIVWARRCNRALCRHRLQAQTGCPRSSCSARQRWHGPGRPTCASRSTPHGCLVAHSALEIAQSGSGLCSIGAATPYWNPTHGPCPSVVAAIDPGSSEGNRTEPYQQAVDRACTTGSSSCPSSSWNAVSPIRVFHTGLPVGRSCRVDLGWVESNQQHVSTFAAWRDTASSRAGSRSES